MPPLPLIGGSLGVGQTFATSTYGTTVTAHASADTKGAAVELVAATTHDAHWVEVMAGPPSAATVSYAIDLLIGAATEAVLIPDLTLRSRAVSDGGGRWLFPVFIPTGSRIAAQVAASTGGTTIAVGVALFNAGITAGHLASTVAQYGTITNSLGVNVDPGITGHTDAAWVELTAATVRDHSWLVLTVANTETALSGATKNLIDIGIGAATEAVLVADLPVGGANIADSFRPEMTFHLPVFVPRGSRLTVRHRCSIGTDGDRDLYCTVHGA